jgi:hypothetical protein
VLSSLITETKTGYETACGLGPLGYNHGRQIFAHVMGVEGISEMSFILCLSPVPRPFVFS